MTADKPDPQDIQDIINHKPFRWMFRRDGKHMIHHHSKGEWGEIRWDWGFVCGAIFSAPVWLTIFLLLSSQAK